MDNKRLGLTLGYKIAGYFYTFKGHYDYITVGYHLMLHIFTTINTADPGQRGAKDFTTHKPLKF